MVWKLPKRKIISTIILVISVGSYVGVSVPPQLFWPASVLGYIIPFLIVLNMIFLLIYLFSKRRLLWVHVIALFFLSPFITMSYRFPWKKKSAVEGHFEVLSLNAKLFRKPGSYQEFSKEMIRWFLTEDSDIKCIQEFSYNPEFKGLSLIQKMQDRGYHYFNYEIKRTHRPGLATFSKHPIVNSGVLNDTDSSNINKCIFTDIKIYKDTVRVYNVHLSSMHIDLAEYNEIKSFGEKIVALTNKLGHGAAKRSHQINELMEHSLQSPHPVIICGDFNEIPYSYNYFEMRNAYHNAFEEKGNGFGFTFNSEVLPIRIDHHFYGNGLQLLAFDTNNSMTWSDHFPLRGVYAINHSQGL